MTKTNFALIGCGFIAPKHITALKELSDNANLVAVCDLNKEKAQKVATEFPNCKIYTDYKKLLKQKNIDIVSICTPHFLHAKITIDAANAKKHILTEKPISMNLKESDEMIDVCKKNGVKLMVIKQNRYNTPIILLKNAVDQGRFGKIFLANVTIRWTRPQSYYDQDEWRGTIDKDLGVLLNQASHHIDLLQWILGPVDSIFAKIDTMTHNIEAEDTAVAIAKFKNGAIATIEATTSIYPKNLEGSIAVFGENGSVKVGGNAANKMEHWEFKDYKNDDALIFSSSENPNVFAFGHINVYKDVIASINNKINPFVDGVEARKSLELIMAIYESAKTGKEIKLPLKT